MRNDRDWWITDKARYDVKAILRFVRKDRLNRDRADRGFWRLTIGSWVYLSPPIQDDRRPPAKDFWHLHISDPDVDQEVQIEVFCNDTLEPSEEPTEHPTFDPIHRPTHEPTDYPTHNPTLDPTQACLSLYVKGTGQVDGLFLREEATNTRQAQGRKAQGRGSSSLKAQIAMHKHHTWKHATLKSKLKYTNKKQLGARWKLTYADRVWFSHAQADDRRPPRESEWELHGPNHEDDTIVVTILCSDTVPPTAEPTDQPSANPSRSPSETPSEQPDPGPYREPDRAAHLGPDHPPVAQPQHAADRAAHRGAHAPAERGAHQGPLDPALVQPQHAADRAAHRGAHAGPDRGADPGPDREPHR